MAQEQATQDPADSADPRADAAGCFSTIEQYVVELPSEDLRARIAGAAAATKRTIYIGVIAMTLLVTALVYPAA